jgi:hypothetical protein
MIIVAALSRPTTLLHQLQKGKSKSASRRRIKINGSTAA